ncbi:MAG: hypothetical protein V3T84_03750 [Phycisphaerales bacterium]
MADTQRRTIVEQVEFTQVFGFPKILRAVTMGFQPPRLALGLVMVAALMVAGRAWDWATEPTIHPDGLTAGMWTEQDDRRARTTYEAAILAYVDESDQPDGDPASWELEAHEVMALVSRGYLKMRRAVEEDEVPRTLNEADYVRTMEGLEEARPRGTFEATARHVTEGFSAVISAIVLVEPRTFFIAAEDLYLRMPEALWRDHKSFTIVYALVLVVVLAFGGGALSRMTACEVGLEEKLRAQDGVDFAIGSWRSLLFSLLLPLLIAAALAGLLVLGGWLLTLPWIDVLGGVLYGLALLAGFGVAFLVISYALGFSLLVPAVACENCDAPDAQQRAYAYVLGRPLHLLGYGLTGLIGLAIGFVVISFIASLMLNFTAGLIGVWSDNSAFTTAGGASLFNLTGDTMALHISWHSQVAGWFVSFWRTVIVGLVGGYVFANYFSGSTIVYLLMRRACDGQEITEIWQPGQVPGTAASTPVDQDTAAPLTNG